MFLPHSNSLRWPGGRSPEKCGADLGPLTSGQGDATWNVPEGVPKIVLFGGFWDVFFFKDGCRRFI